MMTEALDSMFGKELAADRRTAQQLEQEAALALAEAINQTATLHHAGQRDRYRRLLEGAIDHASRALSVACKGGRGPESHGAADQESISATVLRARSTLTRAHAAKAIDALHGAGQLSLSAQRAPTCEACDEGWSRVEAIVQGAEASACVAEHVAGYLENDAARFQLRAVHKAAKAARKAAADARTAASKARRIVEERNDAYTFHTDAGFSFGEGWYLAAAAVLAGVSIQIEPGHAGTRQAERFLCDAGLSHQLRPYRPRPRAMKHTTAIVGRAFRADATGSQHKLRAAFLGEEPISDAVAEWVDARLISADAGIAGRNKVLLWIRDGVHHSGRNTAYSELVELTLRVQRAGLAPILVGDAIRDGACPPGAVDMILFWKDPIFRNEDMRRAQLQFFEHLRMRHGLVGQLGVTTAGMDGPALLGLPTLYLTDEPNVRMREWVGAVPGYEEVVRDGGYLERVSQALGYWGAATRRPRAADSTL